MNTPDQPFAPDDPRLKRDPWQRRAGSWIDRLVALGFVMGLLIPGIALAAGVRSPEIENRRLAGAPLLAAEALGVPTFFAQVDQFLSDSFPFRAAAVQSLARLDYRLLGGSTNPDVTVGEGEWLFLTGELRPQCDFGAEELLGKIDRAAAALAAVDVEFRYVVAPDKFGIYPEKLRADRPIGTPCTVAQRDTLRSGMQARPNHTVELWSGLQAAKAAGPPVPLYFEQDAHWTPHGALLGVESVVESLAPGTWNDDEIVIGGVHRHNADLARLMGLPRVEETPGIRIRPGVEIDKTVIDPGVDISNARDIAHYTVATDRPTVPGRTLFVYDSFYANIILYLVPWFEESIWVHEGDLLNHPEIAATLPDIDTVVFERVERSAYFTDPEHDLRPVAEQEAARAGIVLPEPEPEPEPEPSAPEPSESPSAGPADVTRGQGEWLFLTGSLRPRCDFGVEALLGQVDRAAAALSDVGVDFRYLVAPEKHAIYPEQLPDPLPAGTPCTDEQRPALREGLAGREGHTIGLWTELEALRESQPDLPLYYAQDAHWSPHGAIVAIRKLVESLAPGTWQPDEVTVGGIREHNSDLARLMGQPRVEVVPGIAVRPGVEATRTVIVPGGAIIPSREIVRYTVATDRPVVPGRTLIVYDSYFQVAMGYLAPWLEESVWVHHGDLFNDPTIAEALPPFDNVVFQRTERSIYFTNPEQDLRSVVEAQRRVGSP